MRDALAGGNYAPLQALAHNLKSGAAYLGAAPLGALAGSLEQELRAGRHDRVPLLAPDLIMALDRMLSGLARALPPEPAAMPQADLPGLLTRLEGFLRDDDARAEDALAELQAALQGTPHAEALAALRQAVDDIEYDTALARLAQLARALGFEAERQA
jgi:HPt (histidine-containing phosphotransfer) domain-containing protein